MLKSIIKSYIIDYALNLILEKYQNEFSEKVVTIQCLYILDDYIMVSIAETNTIIYIKYQHGISYSVVKRMKYAQILLDNNKRDDNPVINMKVTINRLNNYEAIALQVINHMRNLNLTEIRNQADNHR